MRIKQVNRYFPALIVLIALLAFTVFAFYQASLSAEERRERLFENRLERIKSSVSLRMVDYVQILKGCRGLFYGSDSITARDWKIYVDNLNIESVYPGIQGIAYAQFISKQDTQRFADHLRKNFYADFQIKSPFKNDFLTPITYIEPFSGRNLRAVGFDMYSDDTRREAMDRAMNTGMAALTKKVILVQETETNPQPGFLLYMPVYRNPESVESIEDRKRNIKGFVYFPFRAKEILHDVSERFKDVHIKIYDGEHIEQENLLFDSDHAAADSDETLTQNLLNIAGTPWLLSVGVDDEFGSDIEKSQPIIILTFGIILSVLFFMMIANIIKRNNQIREELLMTKELDNKKDEFIGIASHELKTPLTSIKAYMQLLERSDLSEQHRKLVSKANSNITKLNNLIGDLLDVSKIQSGHLVLNVAPFELKKMILESVENVQHMYSSHELLITTPIPDLILNADILRLEQAMTNLLVNAIKYSPGAPAVQISINQLEDTVRINVIDSGIGIAPENREKVFDRFYRAKELSPVFSGLGMGLFISSEIVKRHNGEIGVESEAGKGSTFYIILPL